MDNQIQEILAFNLADEQYGIDLLAVQEIRGYENVTRIANSPDFIKGVVNLRGLIVPIIDLRLRFNTGTANYDALTVAIILNVGTKVVGMVVDAVSDVVTLRPDQVKPKPQMGGALDTAFMTGLAAIDDRLITLLDVQALLSCAELHAPEEAFF